MRISCHVLLSAILATVLSTTTTQAQSLKAPRDVQNALLQIWGLGEHTERKAPDKPTLEAVIHFGLPSSGILLSGSWVQENQTCMISVQILKDGGVDPAGYYDITWNSDPNHTGQYFYLALPNIGAYDIQSGGASVFAVDTRDSNSYTGAYADFEVWGDGREDGPPLRCDL